MNKDLIQMAKKAADAWCGTDDYHQAAIIIDMLISEIAAIENHASNIKIKKGDQIWCVDFESGEIEEGEVSSVCHRDGRIERFEVDFKEAGDSDYFYGDALGDNFFASKEDAQNAYAQFAASERMFGG